MEEKKGIGAKDYSLIGMIVSAVALLGSGVYLLITGNLNWESALGSLVIFGGIGFIFSPITFSIFLDKIAKIKHGE